MQIIEIMGYPNFALSPAEYEQAGMDVI